VGWWPFDGTGDDLVGGDSATLFGNPLFSNGKVGQALRFDGAEDYGRAEASLRLDAGGRGGLTVEGWINPADISQLRPILEWNDEAGGIGAHFWISVDTAAPGDGRGDLFANLVDTSGVYHQVRTEADVVRADIFQHVALTYDKEAGVAAIYLNGNRVARTNLGTFAPQTGSPLFFGVRPSGPFSGIYFAGLMDEISVYDRALSASELEAIVRAGASGKCKSAIPKIDHVPVAQSGSVSVNENGSVVITLNVSDADGDPLNFRISPPSHGTLSGAAPNVTYRPAANYNGPDGFSFKVSDGVTESGIAFISIRVNPASSAPVARLTITPLLQLSSGQTNLLIVAPNNSNAVVLLDGSLSSAPDNHVLGYLWFEQGNAVALATGVVAILTFDLGTHTVILLISDGSASSQDAVTFEVVTPGEAVADLLTIVSDTDLPRKIKLGLCASLHVAEASLDRNRLAAAIDQLRAFQNKIRAQLAQISPVNAALLIQVTQKIIDAVQSP